MTTPVLRPRLSPHMFNLSTYAMTNAVYAGRTDRVLELIRAGEPLDPPVPSSIGLHFVQSYLSVAIENNYRTLAELLIWSGASVERAFFQCAYRLAHLHGQPSHPDYWKMEMLLSGVNLSKLRQLKISPISLVISSPSLIRYFAQRGFDPGEITGIDDFDREAILTAAIREDRTESALTLLSVGASPFVVVYRYSLRKLPSNIAPMLHTNHCTLLHLTCRSNAQARVTRALLSRGLGFSGVSPTPLHVAVRARAFDNVHILLDAGADPDEHEGLPLKTALTAGDLEMMQTLAANGATCSTLTLTTHFPAAYQRSHELGALLLACCDDVPENAECVVARCLCANPGEERKVLQNLRALSPLRPLKLT